MVKWTPSEKERARLVRMARTRTAEEIAAELGKGPEEVAVVIEEVRPRTHDWIVHCKKTGRCWRSRTERGAYYLACLHGLVDWDCWRAPQGPKP